MTCPRYLIIYDYDSDETGWLVVDVSKAPKSKTYAEAVALKKQLEAGE